MMNKPVVFFDGVCGLCNKSIDLILRIDRRGLVLFAPLQGALGQQTLNEHGIQGSDFNSMLLVEGGKVYTKSTAILRISRHLGGIWPLGLLLLIVPRPIRDVFYDIIARNRYRWFGKSESCRLPTPAERSRFLD